MKLNISTKISVLVGMLSGVVSITIGLLLHYGSTGIIFDQSLERVKYETNSRAMALINDIDTLRHDVLYLVGTPPISGIPRATFNEGIDPFDNSTIEVWKSRLEIIFSELIRAKSNYRQIRLMRVEDGAMELVRVDRSGTLIKPVPTRKLQRKQKAIYLKGTFEIHPGEVYLSDVALSREKGNILQPHLPVMEAAAPIYFDDELFGMVVINMDFGRIFDTLINTTPRALIPYVTNEAGYFLAHPNSNKTFGFELAHQAKITDDYPSVDLNPTEDLRDKAFTFFEDEHNGTNVIHIVKASFDPLDPKRFLGVALATSNVNLQSESNALRNYALLVVMVLVFCSFLLSSALATQLMKPLRKIAQASEDLAEGRQVDDLPIQAKDEIGHLARSFDYMKCQLEEKEQALLKSQAEAHHANKMASLGEMASGMAHEINSPILEVSMVAERVIRRAKKGNTKDVEEAMEQIVSCVGHISSIIESLRKISRTSDDDPIERVAVKSIINDVVNLSQQRYLLKRIALSTEFIGADESIEVECQRLQISQVLVNLINNAHDAVCALEQRWVKVIVRKNAENIDIAVMDSGSGVAPDVLDKIFEPMFTTKEIGEGTGLGLSISSAIAKKHGGELTYESHAQNTCFVLSIPQYQST